MRLQPLEDRVIVLRDEPLKFKGRVELATPEQQLTGVVTAVGPGRWSPDGSRFLPTFLNPDQRVMFGPQSYEILWSWDPSGRTLCIRHSDLLAVLTEPVADPLPRD